MPPTIEGNFFACVGVLVCGVSFVGVRVFVGFGEGKTDGEVVGVVVGTEEGDAVGLTVGLEEMLREGRAV